MSLLVFAAVASAGAVAAFVTRGWRRAGTLVGFAGLLLALWAALAIEVGDRFEAAGSAIEATAYGRLFVLVGLVASILVLLTGRLTAWQRNAPAAVLGGVASLALALATPETAIGLLAAGGAALVATLVALVAPLTPSRVRVLAREVRGATTGIILGLVAVSLVPGSAGAVPVGAAISGVALLAAVIAVGHRLAAVPLHARASRLADAAPALGLPLLLAWIPAAWVVVLLNWATSAVAPASSGLGLERALVATAAMATLTLGSIAALAQDEIERVAAYTVVASGGVVLLGFAALEPAARDGVRAWLPAFVASTAGIAAWTIAVRGAFDSGRVRELTGWARRGPVLAAALVAIGVAVVGWPGAATWDGRAAVIEALLGSPAPLAAVLVGLVPVLVLVRLVVIGSGQPGPAVIAAGGERPRWGAAVLGPGRGSAHRVVSPGTAASAAPPGAMDAGQPGPTEPAGDMAPAVAGDL